LSLAALTLAGALAGCNLGGSGQIRVVSEPSGATVVLDGATQDTTPVLINHVAPGTHLLTARKEGFRETRRTVSLLPGQKTTVDLSLEPMTGLVLVHSEPTGAVVQLDGAQKGLTPLLIHDFPAGEHRLRLSADGYSPQEIVVRVLDRRPQHLVVRLASESARLAVNSTPPGAAVRLDGAPRGTTPCEIERIPGGEIELTLTLDGFLPHREKMVVHQGEFYELNVSLKAQAGRLSVVSIPEKARVYIDGALSGETPLNLDEIEPGTYRIRVEAANCDPEERQVTVRPNRSDIQEFRLTRNVGILEVVTFPPGVTVLVNGEERGVTEPMASGRRSKPLRIELPQGKHTIRLQKGSARSTSTVQIEMDRVQVLERKLFILDTRVKMKDSNIEQTGMFISHRSNGDVVLETKPGILLHLPGDEIESITPIPLP